MNLVTKKFSQRRIFDFALLLLGVFIIVGVLFFANPKFYANISTHIPSGANGTTETVNDGFVGGDHVQVYYLGWKLKKFLQGDAPSIFADFFNFASDTHLFYDIHVGVQYWLIAVGSLIFGDALGYNLGWVLFPLVLGFVFSYFMLVQITSSRVMCFLGGLFLTFFPYKVSQIFGGHSGGVVFFLLPLFFFAVFRVQRLGGNLPTSALAGVCLFLVTISDEHLGYYLLLFSSMVFPLWGLQALVREKKTEGSLSLCSAVASAYWGSCRDSCVRANC